MVDINLNESNLSQQQLNTLETLKIWMQTEAEFHGKSDDEFLHLFLHSCDYKLEMSKSTLTSYYKAKHSFHRIWRNRNPNDEDFDQLIKQRVLTALTNSSPDQPLVVILSIGRIVPPLSSNFDLLFKGISYAVDLMIANRRTNALNGCILVVDYKDYYWWFILRCLSPIVVKKLIDNFITPVPTKLKHVIAVNTPYIATNLIQLFYPFMPTKYKDVIAIFGSEQSPQILGKFVPAKLLPLEFGGTSSSMKHHEDAFEIEARRFYDDLLDDEKYGYQ